MKHLRRRIRAAARRLYRNAGEIAARPVIPLSAALIAGGAGILGITLPAGKVFFSVLALILVFSGLAGGIAVLLRRHQDWRQPFTNAIKMTLGGTAFLTMLFGIIMTVLSAGDFVWTGSGLQTASFAAMALAGMASLLLLANLQEETTLDGFQFITGERYTREWGLSGLSHVHWGDRNGIPLRVCITSGSPDRHGAPRYVVEITCIIDNPHKFALLAHPDHMRGWPPFSKLPRLPRVPHWDRYIVRGLPAALMPEIIAKFRKHYHTIFSDTYGFERVRLEKNRAHGRFVLDLEEKYRIPDIIEGFSVFAGHFD